MKYIYHVYCQFIKADKFPVEVTHWSFIFEADKRIGDGYSYGEFEQNLWEKAGDNIHSRYKKNNAIVPSRIILRRLI